MENEPEFVFKDKRMILKFKQPPTQEEFDYWAAIASKAIDYANKKTGGNVHIIGWERKES